MSEDHTKKHDDFVADTMGGKHVEDVPGIGQAVGERLREKGITMAEQLYGEFMAFDRREEKFKAILMAYGANQGQVDAAYDAFQAYYQKHSKQQ